MIHNRRISMIKQYSHRLRMKFFFDLEKAQEANYASYFTEQQTQQPPLKPELSSSQESEEEVEDEEGGFSVTDYIQHLSLKEREQFKRENPQLPPLFFMTKAEKKKYFDQLNKTFHKEIAQTPQRRSKTKKILKFRNEFQVKPFNQRQKVVALGRVKGEKEGYQQNIHFS